MSYEHIHWKNVLFEIAGELEPRFMLKLNIDSDVVEEMEHHLRRTLSHLSLGTRPNVAKIAGHVSFWIRKLKPISFSEDSPNKLLVINELVAVLVGGGICARYFDDTSKSSFVLSKRLLYDWSSSLRFNSHSPHSCAITFEMLATSM